MSAIAYCHGYSHSVTYSRLDLVGKKAYLYQHDGGCGSGGDDDSDVKSKSLNAAFWFRDTFLNLLGQHLHRNLDSCFPIWFLRCFMNV